MDERLERIARNEAFFRSVNRRIEELSERTLRDADDPVEFLCECGRGGCEERVWLTPSEYERVHVQDDRFALAPGHATETMERVVERTERYWLVDKLPEAEAVLREHPQ